MVSRRYCSQNKTKYLNTTYSSISECLKNGQTTHPLLHGFVCKRRKFKSLKTIQQQQQHKVYVVFLQVHATLLLGAGRDLEGDK
jgi:hypothetical protein